MNTRMPTDQLVLGAYILQPYAQTEQHIKELAECGVRLIVCFTPKNREVLDLLSKYGVGCIISGVLPGWWGGDGTNSGSMREKNPITLYEEAARTFADHPAVWGIDIGDEPSAKDFPYLAEVARRALELFPNQFPYLNLYPNYAVGSQNTNGQIVWQLGTETYEEYIRQYAEHVDLPYISYDYYLYPETKNHYEGKMMENFRTVSEACRRTGKAFWYIPQVNSRSVENPPSLNMLRYQAYVALCFGATVINWACYTQGWWEHNVLDLQGNKTAQYEKLKAMNAELRGIGERYMEYRTVSTHLVGYTNEPWVTDFPLLNPTERLDRGAIRALCAGGAHLTVGQMIHRTDGNRQAFLICNTSDPCDEHPSRATVTFTAAGRRIALHSGEGEVVLRQSGDNYSFELESNHAILLTVD